MKNPWESQVKPFRIFGNVYFVGNRKASSHMIDTGDGLILIDTGYFETLYQVIENIYALGFDPHDVKYIIHTHGHIDHCGGTKAFVELYGGKTFIGKGDEDYVNGKLDLTWAKELGLTYDGAFEADVIMQDGDKITLGNTTIEIMAAPGHTPGTIAFFFDAEENGRVCKVGMHGGVGGNSMTLEWLSGYGLSTDCRQQFLEGLERLKKVPVEVFLGNHTWNNNTMGKYERSLTEKENPFIDPEGWQAFLEKCKANMEKMIAENT